MRTPPGPPERKAGLLRSLPYYARFAIDPIGFVGSRFAKYGDVYYATSAGGPGLYVIKHPDHLHDLFVREATKFKKQHTAFERLGQVLGDGLLTSDGETWKRQRRLVQPAFTRARLTDYVEVMSDEVERTVGRWKDGDTIDVGAEMMELTLRVVCRALFSHELAGEVDAIGRAMQSLQSSITRPDVLPKWIANRLLGDGEEAVAALDRIVSRLIDERRRLDPSVAPKDLLSALVFAVDEDGGGGLSEREVRDQIVTLMLAGHETTSHTLSWTLHLLGENPDADRRLASELDRDLPPGRPSLDDLDRLPCLAQTLDESLRLYPPAYLVARKAAADARIGDYVVPAGSEVVAWIYFTHRDARWFPDPTAFRPERFTPEATARLPKLAYLPFGAGPRACIGKAFALMEARLLLGSIARRFRFERVPGRKVRPKLRVTLFPAGGLRMKLRRR